MQKIRNLAIIAHVDHGKTTLVDKLLQQTHSLTGQQNEQERVMDSNAIERERGITILAKNTSIQWQDHRINIVDTPGHADFGGEVERILSMVDSVLLLVDAVDGPMPQTRFVTSKAFNYGLKPIVVINKIDRDGARPDWVVDQVFDLFDQLGATDEQLDFPIIYTSALHGFATLKHEEPSDNMDPLLHAIIQYVPPPVVDVNAPFQMQISTLHYSSYVGTIGIGRITQGTAMPRKSVTVIDREGNTRSGKILQVMQLTGLEKTEIESAQAGDIVAISGIDGLKISDTLCDPEHVVALSPLTVDEPTIHMTFQVNDSPFAGKDGKYITSRRLRDRLQTELQHNVALRVEDTENPDKFRVSGRGELHLSILVENMRREGYELAISRPQVIMREVDGQQHEPFEQLVLDIEAQHQGSIIEAINLRRGVLKDMQPDDCGRVRLEYVVPTRGLIGFHTDFLTTTSGTGIMHHVFDHYGPTVGGTVASRHRGALIANAVGRARGFALWNLQERGKLFIVPQTEVYEGMIIGMHSRDNDLVVNALREKKLTNVRASGTDESILLTPPIKMTLEKAMEWINDDELVEVTPNFVRLRKRYLKEHERKRQSRAE